MRAVSVYGARRTRVYEVRVVADQQKEKEAY